MTVDMQLARLRWATAVALQHTVVAECDALPLQRRHADCREVLRLNEAIRELLGARDELREAGVTLSSGEWARAYNIHREAMIRWGRETVLFLAVETNARQQRDIAEFYERLGSGRVFDRCR